MIDDDTNERRSAPDTTPSPAYAREGARDRKMLDEAFSDIDRDLSRDVVPAEARNEPDRTADERRDATSLPDEITKRYYCRKDHLGEEHVYADSKASREIFQASENRLRTKVDDPQCVKMMLDTAAHRGWSSITAKGSDEFRRETWLEGQARGIEVKGYRPNELDLQELKKREQAHLRNEIAPAMVREGGEPERASSATQDGPGARQTAAEPERQRQADYRSGIEGVLIEQGSRPYRDGPGADPSPYAVLRDEQGREHTAWGVGIPNAMMQAGARKGDQVRLRETGMEQVTKSVIREADGQLARVEQQVNRRSWEADVSRTREDLEQEGQKVVNDRETPGAADREQRIQAVGAKAEAMVDARDQALHVGAGRDAAVTEGIYANEARAKEYMAQGRAAAGSDPALRGAASMEAYVERKVRAKLGNDPVAVDRVMNMARARIGNAVASGYDFPKVRVEETRERSANEPERGAERGREDDRAQNAQGQREARPDLERDQERDRDRELDRARERQQDRGRER